MREQNSQAADELIPLEKDGSEVAQRSAVSKLFLREYWSIR
jgi:hypothetical protein